MKNNLIILGVETSCDETSASIIRIDKNGIEILSNVVSSQIDIHKKYGGVVPEVAARHHLENILPVINEALSEGDIPKCRLPDKIDFLAVTAGPGLVTSLVIGVETVKTLSCVWQKPLIAVNHMYAHIAANFFPPVKYPDKKAGFNEVNPLCFPAICLVVSGGHTELIYLKDYWHYQKIGQTVDDAAGEAFDKVARLLGLGYPGGPIVSAEAAKFSPPFQGGVKGGLPESRQPLRPYGAPPLGKGRIIFPRPMIKSNDFNFSFSGLKTAVLYAVQKMSKSEVKKRTPEICYEFQEAVIDVLVAKTIKAAKKYNAKTVLLCGGVAANKKLRGGLKMAAEKTGKGFLVPEFKLCTDNAAMAAVAGYYLAQQSQPRLNNWQKIKVEPNWELV